MYGIIFIKGNKSSPKASPWPPQELCRKCDVVCERTPPITAPLLYAVAPVTFLASQKSFIFFREAFGKCLAVDGFPFFDGNVLAVDGK